MKSKMKELFLLIKNSIIEEYKFIIFLALLFIILQIPLNYYITTGGGASDVSSRIRVKEKYDSKGSFNISYVTQLKGTILTYGLSFIIPSWERGSADDYKYNENENTSDIDFRSDIYLKSANSIATYWAYTLANKEIKEVSNKMYVITVFNEENSQLKVKDQIVSVDGKKLLEVNALGKYLQTKKEGDEVNLVIIRHNKEKLIKNKLVRDKQTGRLVIGIALQNVREYETNPGLDIKFKKSESGPSGGLITTLEIYNQLTRKDLTHGLKIAGTGTIDENGKIGPIGGVEYKVLGAHKAKADIFLVPSEKNYKQAKKYVKEKNLKIKLIKVKTIEDAINKLEGLK